jgi:biotin carboxylase
VAHGRDRAEALARMQAALRACHVEGVQTNLALQQAILDAPAFQSGGVDARFLPGLLRERSLAEAAHG